MSLLSDITDGFNVIIAKVNTLTAGLSGKADSIPTGTAAEIITGTETDPRRFSPADINSAVDDLAGGNPFDQDLNTTDSVEFVEVTAGSVSSNLFTVANEGKIQSSSTLGMVLETTGSQKPIVFRVNDSGQKEIARFDAGGNFGIGTATPTEALDVVGNAVFSGRMGIGGPASTSSHALRVHGAVWANSLVQLSELGGSGGVGNIKFYDNGASFNVELYGTHDSENVKGIFQLTSKDATQATLATSILHADTDFLDNPSLVWRSKNNSANSFMMANYHHETGGHFVTSKTTGGDASIRFAPGRVEAMVIKEGGDVEVIGTVTAGDVLAVNHKGPESIAYFGTTTGSAFMQVNSSYTQFVKDVRPASDGAYDLGLSYRRWKGIFGETLNTSGTVTSAGDVEITDTTKGVILKSPDGTRYRITVANGGALVSTAI